MTLHHEEVWHSGEAVSERKQIALFLEIRAID